MGLLNVKNGKSLGTLSPFGIWNRIKYDPVNIWLESGMLNYSMTYFNPESYKPASWQFNSQFSLIGGSLGLELKNFDVVLGSESTPAVIPKAIRVLYSVPPSGKITESKAIGCEEKTDTITMINPRGDEAVCTYTYIPAYQPPAMIPNPSSLGSLMDYVNAQAIIATSPVSTDGVQEHCIKPDHISEGYAEKGNKVFCSEEIMKKKFCRTLYPPSLCSGKLRLYLQCVYGGVNIKYQLDESASALKNLYVGLYPGGGDIGRSTRTAVFGRGTHFLFTYNYHHFLIRTMGFAVNPLVPMGVGHKLKRWLISGDKSGYSADVLSNIEAYLLTTSFPTLSVYPPGASSVSGQLYKYGYPFDFGLNANWNGDSACAVFQKNNAENYRVTTLVDVSVTCSGLEEVLDAELDRKCSSLIKRYLVSKGTDFYPQGLNRHYVSEAYATEVDDPDHPGDKIIKIFGDVDDGEWWYFNHNGDEGAETEVKQKNRVYGGLPYTKECLDEIGTCFSFSASPSSSSPWMEEFQIDKIYVWDPFYNDYQWRMGCNPLSPDDRCPPNHPAGEYPVYAYYNRQGTQIICNYYKKTMSEGDDEIQPPEGLCGPGSDQESSKKYTEGYLSGFQTSQSRAVKRGCTSYDRYAANWSVSGGTWKTGKEAWAAVCGCGFCDGNVEPTGGGIGWFFTHWTSIREGEGMWHSEEAKGGGGHFSCVLIPKDDCQALHIASSQDERELSTTIDATYSHCGNAQKCSKIWWQGTKKVVGEQSRGWITCFGVYFAKAFFNGPMVDENGAGLNPDLWATSNWCIYYPGGSEVGRMSCYFRKWGPDGPESFIVGLIPPYFGTETSRTDKNIYVVKQEVVGYYITPFGNGISTMQGEAQGQSEKDYDTAEGNIKLDNPYWILLRYLEIRWPYANCGPQFNSNSTTNKNGLLSTIIGAPPFIYPKPWPFSKNYVYPVGYV